MRRFVDRDMVARYTGMSVGSGTLQARSREIIEEDPTIIHELATASELCEAISSSLPPLNDELEGSKSGSDGEVGDDPESGSEQTDRSSIFDPDSNLDA